MRTLIGLVFASTLFAACSGRDAAPQAPQSLAPEASIVTVRFPANRHVTSVQALLSRQRELGPQVRVAGRRAR